MKKLLLISVCLMIAGIFVFKKWETTPSSIMNNLYNAQYVGTNEKALKLMNLIQSYRNERYSKPQVRSNYSDGSWQGISDFYLYSEKDGSVVDVKAVYFRFKTEQSIQGIVVPRLVDVIDFQEIKQSKSIND